MVSEMEIGARLGHLEAKMQTALGEIRGEREMALNSRRDISDRLEKIEETLHGNGRPGILERLASGDAMLLEVIEMRKRLTALELRIYLAMGGFAVALWVVEHLVRNF